MSSYLLIPALLLIICPVYGDESHDLEIVKTNSSYVDNFPAFNPKFRYSSRINRNHNRWQDLAREAFKNSESPSYIRDRLKNQPGVGHLFVYVG